MEEDGNKEMHDRNKKFLEELSKERNGQNGSGQRKIDKNKESAKFEN